VAFSRHKWDDYTPHFYVTRDYGVTWTELATALPQDHPARVIREDPVRKDLLFAGTEYGVWISFNGGRGWQSFQQGIPIVPISDIQLYHDDLIIATEGRGFWVLDDITPLRQLTPTVAAAKLFLFPSAPAVRLSAGARSGGLGGAANLRYSLGTTLGASDTLQLDIVNAAGVVVRHVATAGGATATNAEGRGAGGGRGGGGGGGGGAGGGGRGRGGAVERLATARGVNQFTWDFRGRETAAMNVHAMPSGTYTARLTLAGTTVSQPFRVLPDPRAGGTPADEREHATMVTSLATMIADVNRLLTELRDVRSQTRALVERASSAPSASRDAALRSMIAGIDSVESTAVTETGGGGIDIMHFTPKLNTDLSGLLSAVEGSSAPVTSGEREQFARLRTRFAALRASAERLLTSDLSRVNSLITSSGLTPLTRRPSP
jgi:hypothetical protein